MSELIDILPPAHIRDAAESVRVWMEQNGNRGRWILGGVCSRAHAEKVEASLHAATEALNDIADIMDLPTGCSIKDIVAAVRGGAE